MNVALLRQFIVEMIEEIQDYRVPNQLIPKKSNTTTKTDKESDKDKEEEVDEVSVAANVAGFMAPLGFSSEDAKGPGAGKRVKKKSSARWK